MKRFMLTRFIIFLVIIIKITPDISGQALLKNKKEEVRKCSPVLLPPKNLQGPETVLPWEEIDLLWEAPGTSTWLQWDDGINNSYGVGLTGGGTFYVVSHWYPEDLSNYNGFYLNKIKYYHYDNATTASFVIKVWQGENAGTLLLSQNVVESIPGQWNEVVLDTPIPIDDSQELWFGYKVTHPDQENPAGVDNGPAIQSKGDMFSFDGISWVSISEKYSLDYNWNLAARVSPGKGNNSIDFPFIKKISGLDGKSDSGRFDKTEPYKINTGYKDTLILSYYNVYRDGEFYDSTTTTFYNDFYLPGDNPEPTYFVTAVYNGLYESGPSNSVTVLVIISNTNEYNTVIMKIYPNPATTIVNIESEIPIKEIKVYNYAGRVVASERVNGKICQLKTSQYKPGIYFMRIKTEIGIISKRIVIE